MHPAYELGLLMFKEAARVPRTRARAPKPAVPAAAPAAAGAAPEAAKGFRGVWPIVRNFLVGAPAGKGMLGGLGSAGKLGLLAAGGLGLWNMARTGSPFKHDYGYTGGSPMGSYASQIARSDPLAQFGGMEPASANYWDAVTMAALQREAQSQNALERIRMLRRLGTGA